MESKNKFSVNKTTFQIIIAEYKEYLLPYAIIVASILILVFLVIPQIQQYFTLKEKLDVEKQKLEVIKNNYNFLSELDEASLDANLATLSRALPPTKDFAGVINAISFVSSKTGVSVGDFSFDVGDVSDKKKVVAAGVNTTEFTFPTFQITINLTGASDSIMKFVEELYKTVPLSEVTSVIITDNAATLTTLFYYRTYPPINVSDEQPIKPLSSDTQSLISSLNNWGNAKESEELPLSDSFVSTTSASGNYIPF